MSLFTSKNRVAHAVADEEDTQAFLAQQDAVDVAAAEWLLRREEGLSAVEEQAFQAWLDANAQHGQALQTLEGVWGGMDRIPAHEVAALRSRIGTDDMLQPHQASAQGRSASHRTECLQTSRAAHWVLLIPRLAVLLFAISMMAALWLGWQSWQEQAVFVRDYVAQRGEHRKVELPDGSQLWLDAQTQARVVFYRQRREVQLRYGQAFFDVHADVHRPFAVQAGDLRVTVLGTRFAVSHWGDETPSQVSVESGRVQAERTIAVERSTRTKEPAAASDLLAILGAGDRLTLEPEHGDVTQSLVGDAAPWRSGRVVFDGVSLAQAIAQFERYGDTRIVIDDPAVAALGIQGSFDLQSLGAFLRALPQVLPVQLQTLPDGRQRIEMRR